MSNGLLCLLFAILGFLSGSVMYSAIITRFARHIDIRKVSDDGNAGAFNAFAHCGVVVGAICLICDILKGFIPVLLGVLFCNIHSFGFIFVIIAPVLGHAVGMFSNFKGGKCISTIFGVMIALVWVCPELFILAGIYVVTCLLPGIHSNRTRSIIAFSCFLVVAFIVEATAGRIFIAIGCSLCALISIVRHLQSKEGNVDEQREIDEEEVVELHNNN